MAALAVSDETSDKPVRERIVARLLLYDLRGKRVFVAGHKGMAGSASSTALSRKV